MNILNDKYEIANFIAGSGGTSNGSLVVISSGKVIKATDPVTAATLVGIALETADADAVVPVAVLQDGAKLIAPYTGSLKTSLAATDLGTVFDLSTDLIVDLDDTTGGCALCVGYDNNVETITFMVPKSFLYL